VDGKTNNPLCRLDSFILFIMIITLFTTQSLFSSIVFLKCLTSGDFRFTVWSWRFAGGVDRSRHRAEVISFVASVGLRGLHKAGIFNFDRIPVPWNFSLGSDLLLQLFGILDEDATFTGFM
jgi:hypothetical protein